MIKEDLGNTVAENKRPLPGTNTMLFGDNRQGKCGVGKQEHFVHNPSGLYAKFKKIDCGHHHSLALDDNRILYSWGRDKYG